MLFLILEMTESILEKNALSFIFTAEVLWRGYSLCTHFRPECFCYFGGVENRSHCLIPTFQSSSSFTALFHHLWDNSLWAIEYKYCGCKFQTACASAFCRGWKLHLLVFLFVPRCFHVTFWCYFLHRCGVLEANISYNNTASPFILTWSNTAGWIHSSACHSSAVSGHPNLACDGTNTTRTHLPSLSPFARLWMLQSLQSLQFHRGAENRHLRGL